MVEEGISDAVVVGHSVSGVWLQLLLGQAPERISRMVFINAIILKNGESFISNAVGPAQVPPCCRCCACPPSGWHACRALCPGRAADVGTGTTLFRTCSSVVPCLINAAVHARSSSSP